jgi:phosphonate transport system permease protein
MADNQQKAPSKSKQRFLSFFGKRSADHFTSPEEAYKADPHLWIWDIVFYAAIVIVIIWMYFDLNINDQWSQRTAWSTLGDIFNGLFHPNWDYFWGTGVETDIGTFTFENSVIFQILQTFGIAFLGTFFSAFIAIPFGLLASDKLVGKYSWISAIFLILIRTFPELLLGYIMIKLSGFTAFTGVLAIGLHSIGMIGKLYSEQVDGISMEPVEALDACGGTTMQKLHCGVMPQCEAGFVSTALYRFDINVRTATLLGVVCGDKCGIGHYIGTYSINRHWSLLGSAIFGVIILVVLIDIVSAELRKKLV